MTAKEQFEPASRLCLVQALRITNNRGTDFMIPVTARVIAMSLLISTAQPTRAEEPSARSLSVTTHIMVSPEEISWGECPPFLPAGAKCAVIEGDPQIANALFTLRSKLPGNYRIPPHFHPTDEHITVLSGTFAMGLGKEYDEKSMTPMGAGSFMVSRRVKRISPSPVAKRLCRCTRSAR